MTAPQHIKELQRTIEKARRSEPPNTGNNASELARGLNMVCEFVCAILVGAGLGWGFDHVLPVAAPAGLVAGTLLGFCTGVCLLVKMTKDNNTSQANIPPDER